MCEICLKLTIKTPERRGVFMFNFEQISHIVLVFSLLTLNKKIPAGLLLNYKVKMVISIRTINQAMTLETLNDRLQISVN